MMEKIGQSFREGAVRPGCEGAATPSWVSRFGPLQVSSHLGGALIAQAAVLFQGFIDDVFQPGRDRGVQPDGRHGRAVENCLEDDAGVSPGKGRLPVAIS